MGTAASRSGGRSGRSSEQVVPLSERQIDEVLGAIRKAWVANDDMSLGQLIAKVASSWGTDPGTLASMGDGTIKMGMNLLTPGGGDFGINHT